MLRITMTVGLLALGCAPQDENGHHPHHPSVDAGVSVDCLDQVGVICTVAGDGESALAGDGGPAADASLSLPLDVTVGPDGRLYLVDFNNSVIRAIDGATSIIDTVAGSGELGGADCAAELGQPARDLCLNHPTAVAFDRTGQMWIAGFLGSRAIRIDLSIERVIGVVGTGRRAYDGEEGPAAEASFDLVSGLATDDSGGVYLTDQQNQLIRYVDPDGVIHRYAGQCIVDQDLVTGEDLCTDAEEPAACPDSDKLACGDPAELCLRPCVPDFAGDGGAAREMRLSFGYGEAADPSGQLALAPAGDLYVSDSRNRRVRVIASDGIARTIAGTGEAGSGGDGGPATEAQLDFPADLALAGDGTLFIADPWASCVRRISPGGVIDTVAGVCGADHGFDGDGGPASEAHLSLPFGLAIDDCILYIADTGNNRLRAVRLW